MTHVASTGSTNDDLMRAVEAGEAGDRYVLVADHQTNGRGRLDRVWEAPPGVNLLVSIAFMPVPPVAVQLTHRVGLATVAAIRALLPSATAVGLKWPNDVLIDGRKVAGILARRSSTADAVVVGLGLNVGWAPEGAASIGSEADPAEVLAIVLAELDRLPVDVNALYRENLETLGRIVRVELPGDVDSVEGRAIDVDQNGRLLVLDERAVTHRFDVGDVVHVRPATGGDED